MKKLVMVLVAVVSMGGIAIAGDNDSSPPEGDEVVCPDGYVVIEGLNTCKQDDGGSECPPGWEESVLGTCACDGLNGSDGSCTGADGNPVQPDCPYGYMEPQDGICVPYCLEHPNSSQENGMPDCTESAWWEAPTWEWETLGKIITPNYASLTVLELDSWPWTVTTVPANWTGCSPGFIKNQANGHCRLACKVIAGIPCPSEENIWIYPITHERR